jgi:hypothetical protein
MLCLDSLARASGNHILNCSASPWKCRASSPAFSWGSSNSISLQEFPLTDLFLAMFLILPPPSMREVVGAGNHKTAAAMVNAADALWDAQGSHDPTVAAAMPQRRRSLAPNNGKRGDKRSSTPAPKVTPLPTLIFTHFKTLAMASVNSQLLCPQGSQVCFSLCLVGKLTRHRTPFSSAASLHTPLPRLYISPPMHDDFSY